MYLRCIIPRSVNDALTRWTSWRNNIAHSYYPCILYFCSTSCSDIRFNRLFLAIYLSLYKQKMINNYHKIKALYFNIHCNFSTKFVLMPFPRAPIINSTLSQFSWDCTDTLSLFGQQTFRTILLRILHLNDESVEIDIPDNIRFQLSLILTQKPLTNDREDGRTWRARVRYHCQKILSGAPFTLEIRR